MRQILPPLLRAVANSCGRALTTYGLVVAPMVPTPQAIAAGPWDGPPPGHPERLRPDLPLSAVERDLLLALGRG